MADIVEDCRKTAGALEDFGRVSVRSDPAFIDILRKSATEIEKLRRENKALRARNAALVVRNIIFAFLLAGSICVVFMAMFLVR